MIYLVHHSFLYDYYEPLVKSIRYELYNQGIESTIVEYNHDSLSHYIDQQCILFGLEQYILDNIFFQKFLLSNHIIVFNTLYNLQKVKSLFSKVNYSIHGWIDIYYPNVEYIKKQFTNTFYLPLGYTHIFEMWTHPDIHPDTIVFHGCKPQTPITHTDVYIQYIREDIDMLLLLPILSKNIKVILQQRSTDERLNGLLDKCILFNNNSLLPFREVFNFHQFVIQSGLIEYLQLSK